MLQEGKLYKFKIGYELYNCLNWTKTSYFYVVKDDINITGTELGFDLKAKNIVLNNVEVNTKVDMTANGKITFNHGSVLTKGIFSPEPLILNEPWPVYDNNKDLVLWHGAIYYKKSSMGKMRDDVKVEFEKPIDNPAMDLKEFIIYPNPTNNSVTLEFSDPNEIQQIKIIDTHGKCLHIIDLVQKRQVINISDYPSGLYIVQIKTGSKTMRKKLIKQK